MGSSNENSAFGPVHNPWDLDRVPGGSSGGSAAAVAAGEAVWALGTDTGGSVRQPASLCGVVGVKPTYGRYQPLRPDRLRVLAGHGRHVHAIVRDAASLLEVIAGHDPRDATSSTLPVPPYADALERRGRRAAGRRGHRGVRRGRRARRRRLGPRGGRPPRAARRHGRVRSSLPHADYALSAYYLIAPSRGVVEPRPLRRRPVRLPRAGRARDCIEMMFATRGAGFGPEVKRRIMLGTYALSAGYYDAYYGQAQKVRTLVIRDYERGLRALRRARLADVADDRVQDRREGRRPAGHVPERHLHDPREPRRACRPSASRAGLADAGLPVGRAADGAGARGEPTLLRAAHALRARPGRLGLRPPIIAG